MKEIALHLLDLAENSLSAGAKSIRISVCEDLDADLLTTRIEDDGCGMDQETLQKITDPFFTSRTTRSVGLGLPFLKAATQACNGDLKLFSKPGNGTQIEGTFQHSHIDRMPLGDLATTFLDLVVTHPGVHWSFRYISRVDEKQQIFEFDDEPVKKMLGEIHLTHPDVLTYLRETLEEGLGVNKKR